MDNTERNKIIKKAAKYSVNNKYKRECWGFWFALLGLFYIEFLPFIHCPSIWNDEVCLKINNLTSQLLLAYIASYIFFYINLLKKEQQKYEDYYPRITILLQRLFSVFDSHEKRLASLYKDAKGEDTFIYNKESIETVIDYLEEREKIYIETYGTSAKNDYTPANEISGSNYLTAGQISYDIEKLSYFNDILSSDYKIKLFDISQNLYLTSFKNNLKSDLVTYKLLIEDEIELYKKIKDLKEHSNKIFGTDF